MNALISSLPARKSAFTLVELIVVIAVLAVLAGLVVESYSNVRLGARQSAAQDTVALMNRALLHFNQSNWDLVLDAVPDSTTDELAILRTLQWRDPDATKAAPGSPYLPSTLNATASSDQNDFRVHWNGRTFGLLRPGVTGTGLKIDKNSSSGTFYTYPDNYQPVAANREY